MLGDDSKGLEGRRGKVGQVVCDDDLSTCKNRGGKNVAIFNVVR